ncbi:hypothetical protein NBZ79_00610 [Sneathiella marina]|uniref:Uncharacterized protein n=1 Tax=Sneathiella marina TaxID=2950108 RepID=A0ABY4W2R9_9PROT|nr:hypothetical protein [Sneathiella marina]USG61476.1 hypothetical protein NBZ79_00610 [Sneathiella marina]
MKTAFQLAKEFWLPLIVAIAWTFFNFYPQTFEDIPIAGIINIFGPTFFLASWLSGQYFRVRKQTRVQDDLSRLIEKTSSLLERLDEKTADLVSHITGGDSFCFMAHSNLMPGVDRAMTMIIHQGIHPLYDIRARIVDLQAFRSVQNKLTPENLNKAELHRSYGELTRGLCTDSEVWDLGKGTERDFNIFWTTRSGPFSQYLKYRKHNNRWIYATKVVRGNDVLYETIQEDFPRNTAGEVDW